MIELEHLLFVCTWLILYLILQLCTWIILRAWLSSRLAFPASFAVSLLSSCLVSWYLAWLGFSPVYTLGIFLILTGVVFGTVPKARVGILSDLKEGGWYYALFFLVFFIMLLFRMFSPDINGHERFMDHAFLASIMRTPVVPPLDPWFAGGTLDVYYYLGHWCFATLGIIGGIPSWIVFQFGVPTVASVSAVQLYGIGKLLLRKFSLLPVILLFKVNFAYLYLYFCSEDQIILFNLLWDSISIIPNAANEFPLFTFLFADMHAHGMGVFNQTFLILMLVYLFTQWQKLINSERAICALLAGLSLGTMVGMNAWDALAYGPIFILAAIIIWYQTHRGAQRVEFWSVGTWLSKACAHVYHDICDVVRKRSKISHSSGALLYLLILVPLIAFLSYAQLFLMMNGEGVQGVGIVSISTPLSDFFLIFGLFLFPLVCTLYSDIKKQPELLVIAIPFVIAGYPVLALIFVLLTYLIARHDGVSDFLFGCGLALVLLCEFIYIVDGTSWSQFYRANTVLKFYFSAWFLLGVGALCSASIRVEQFMDQVCHGEMGALIEKCITTLVVGAVLVLILSVPLLIYDIRFLSYDNIRGLDGFSWMERAYPEDYAAVMYLHKLPGEYVLVEAQEGAYLYYGRISVVTGIPTILGWTYGHESLWRGNNPPGWEYERTMDIRAIYEQPERAREIMEKYNANFLILGAPERALYQIPDDLGAYLPDLVPAFTSGETVIYQRVAAY
jgi:YYY domain-containing protein